MGSALTFDHAFSEFFICPSKRNLLSMMTSESFSHRLFPILAELAFVRTFSLVISYDIYDHFLSVGCLKTI